MRDSDWTMSTCPMYYSRCNEKEKQEAVAEIKRRNEAQEEERAEAGADGATVEMSAESAESGFADDSESKD